MNGIFGLSLQEWVAHDNQGRPHASLGPGIPDMPPEKLARPKPRTTSAAPPPNSAGLHEEYRLSNRPLNAGGGFGRRLDCGGAGVIFSAAKESRR